MSTERHETKRIWGRSNPCPECGGPGYLDRIDLVDRIMFEHCVVCRHRYEEHEQSLSLLYRN